MYKWETFTTAMACSLVSLLQLFGCYILTITADMINIVVESGHMEQLFHKGILMLGIALLSGVLTLLGLWLCP